MNQMRILKRKGEKRKDGSCYNGASICLQPWFFLCLEEQMVMSMGEGMYFQNLTASFTTTLLVVQLFSRDQLFATPWTAACQASLSFTISLSLH